MSRAARNSKVLRAGAIGFVAGLATLGVVAHASPAHGLIAGALGETTPSAKALAAGKHRVQHTQQTQSQDQWLLPQDPSQQQNVQPQDQSQQYAQPQDQSQQYAQPQYQQPQQQYVQPAPSQQPQSQAR